MRDRQKIHDLKNRDSMEFERKRAVPIKAAANESAFQASALINDDIFLRFRKLCMKKGKTEKIDRLLMQTFELIKAKQVPKWRSKPTVITDPKVLLRMAVENARPLMNIKHIQVI